MKTVQPQTPKEGMGVLTSLMFSDLDIFGITITEGDLSNRLIESSGNQPQRAADALPSNNLNWVMPGIILASKRTTSSK